MACPSSCNSTVVDDGQPSPPQFHSRPLESTPFRMMSASKYGSRRPSPFWSHAYVSRADDVTPPAPPCAEKPTAFSHSPSVSAQKIACSEVLPPHVCDDGAPASAL